MNFKAICLHKWLGICICWTGSRLHQKWEPFYSKSNIEGRKDFFEAFPIGKWLRLCSSDLSKELTFNVKNSYVKVNKAKGMSQKGRVWSLVVYLYQTANCSCLFSTFIASFEFYFILKKYLLGFDRSILFRNADVTVKIFCRIYI